MSNESSIQLPQPEDISRAERDDAMGAYFMMFAAWGIGLPFPFLNLIAAGIYYGLNKKKSRFVAFHALQSLSSQLPVTAANAGMLFWLIWNLVRNFQFTSTFWFSLAAAVALNLAYFTTSIIALTRAYKGNFFYIPFFGRWAFDVWYGPNATKDNTETVRPNRPPEGF